MSKSTAAYQRIWRERNKEHARQYNRRWCAANPEKVIEYKRIAKERRDPNYYRQWHLGRKYGISILEWDTLFEAQGRRCAICRTDTPGSKMGWHTDHAGPLPCCKENIRGILCLPCNHNIGKGNRSDAIRLRRQMQYVEKYLD